MNSVNYPIPASIDTAADDFIDLYNAIRNAYLSGTFEPLATQLADNNNLSPELPNLSNLAQSHGGPAIGRASVVCPSTRIRA